MQFDQLGRRKFITLLGGAVATWPLVAQAQQPERMRRIGVLMPFAADDPQSPIRIAGLLKGLQQRGWIEGRNIRLESRWGAGDAGRIRSYAAELVALAPDLILATGTATMGPLRQVSGVVPIVFVNVVDPVGAGFVESLARPGGNATGFTQFEFGIGAKWLELLKQIAPRMARVAIIRDPEVTSGIGQLGAIQAAAPSFGVELKPIDARDADVIERGIDIFARESHGGLIVPSSASAIYHREKIIALAAKHRLAAIYPYRVFAADGGLISYGPDPLEPYERAAGYVDRILRGEKPANLPVQAPTRYELVINLKTAIAAGLTVPATLLATAVEVIE